MVRLAFAYDKCYLQYTRRSICTCEKTSKNKASDSTISSMRSLQHSVECARRHQALD